MAALKRRSYDMILGLFVALGLIVLVFLVFLIGRERRLFDTSVDIETHFPNVAGLALGADVMLSGVVVGHVSKIKFPLLRPDTPGLSRDITVVMGVSKDAMELIREDSLARIDSKGLLGDKLINISIGSPQLPQIQAGGMLKSTPPIDFNKALQQAQEILENVTETVADARDIFKSFSAQGGDSALAGTAKSLQKIFKEIESGQGVLHEIIFDKKAGSDAKTSIASVSTTMKKVDEIIGDLKSVIKAVKEGDGLVHALLYDPEGQKTIARINSSFKQLDAILKEVENGDGIVHDLIYAKDEGQFLRSLNKAAADVEVMVSDLKNGKGSLGLLLKDPSLYNEIYGLIGNLRRNRLLKAVIRMGISGPSEETK